MYVRIANNVAPQYGRMTSSTAPGHNGPRSVRSTARSLTPITVKGHGNQWLIRLYGAHTLIILLNS